MSSTQAPKATAQGEILLAKYLTDSIRSIEQAIRKSAPAGATMGNLPRSLSVPRLDSRSEGRRPATEVLLPRKLPASHAPAAAAALAATRRDDFGHTHGGPGRPSGNVVHTQSRLLQPGQAGGYGPPPLPPRSSGGAPLPPRPAAGASAAPPLPPKPAVVRTAHAIAAALQNQQQQQQAYGRSGGGGRSASAPRIDEQPQQPHHHQYHQHHQHHQHHQQQQHHHQQYGGQARHAAQSEARIPAVSFAPPLAGLVGGGGGGGGGGHDARSAASLRRSAPSEIGSHNSWWRWRPVTDASYPLTAVTDRYAQSMSPSEAVKWNDRVARLEAEITQEKQRRKQFEEQLKKLQVATSPSTATAHAPLAAPGGAGGGGARSRGGAPPFR